MVKGAVPAVAAKGKAAQAGGASGSRAAKTIPNRHRKRNGLWLPSEDKPPAASLWQRRVVDAALKKGSVVLTISGKFLQVPLGQRLSLRRPCPFGRTGKDLKRYEGYMLAQTVREAFKLGALPGDLTYDVRCRLLRFLPALEGAPVTSPLPMSQWPPGIRAPDGRAPWWLPENWAHGVKTTCRTRLPVFIAPNTRTCYHQETIEAIVQEELGNQIERIVSWATKQMSELKDWSGDVVRFDPDGQLFSSLSKAERAHLPSADELHFAVISARRANELSGIRGIVNVQSRFLAAGIRPRWYVDAASLTDYRRLGLDAVAGGKLTPSRNKALRDAARLRKACVQASDDIHGWEYYDSNLDAAALRSAGASSMLRHANAVCGSARVVISPLAAARFLLAKMRAAEPRPRLGGVLPTGNGAMAMLAAEITPTGFILGDFFVHDGSPCRFDEAITLKEDYDFTCSHLARHGCVMRCNRMVLKVMHETNPGGAVDMRDAKGDAEHRNISILMKKWPGVFKLHSTRGDTQVKMSWGRRS